MRAPPLCALALALPGCGVPLVASSEDVSTRDVNITLDATNAGSGVVVTVELHSPVGDPRLTAGDALRVRAGGQTFPLAAVEGPNAIKYEANVGDVSGAVVLDFVREVDRSALGLTTPVPPPFTLAVAPVTSGQPIALSWDPGAGGYAIGVSITGDCIEALGHALSLDTGAYTIVQAELQHATPGAAATCPLTVTMTRSYPAEAGSVLATMPSGSFSTTVLQSRSVTVSWGP